MVLASANIKPHLLRVGIWTVVNSETEKPGTEKQGWWGHAGHRCNMMPRGVMADRRRRAVAMGCCCPQAEVTLRCIYRRMACEAREAIITLRSTLVRSPLNMMPSLSLSEMWGFRAGNKVTGNHHSEWKLRSPDRRRPPFVIPPIVDGLYHRRREGGRGEESCQPEISLPPAGLSA